jgi:hypothetical protein
MFQSNFTISQGTVFTKSFTVFIDPAMSVQANLVGFTGSMNVVYSYDTIGQVIATYSTEGGNMTIDAPNSNVIISIANNDFANVQFASAQDSSFIDLVYDVLLTDANANNYRIAAGTLTVNRAITQ